MLARQRGIELAQHHLRVIVRGLHTGRDGAVPTCTPVTDDAPTPTFPRWFTPMLRGGEQIWNPPPRPLPRSPESE